MLNLEAASKSCFRIELETFPMREGFSKWIEHGREQLFRMFQSNPDYRRVFCLVVAVPSQTPGWLKTDLFWWEEQIPGEQVHLYPPAVMAGFIASFPVENSQAATYTLVPSTVGLMFGASHQKPQVEIWDVAEEPFTPSTDQVLNVALKHQLLNSLKTTHATN